MTTEQGATEAAVKIRTPRQAWIGFLVCGGFFFAIVALDLSSGPFRPDLAAVGCLLVAEALWVRTLGVDLTPTAASLRGFRQRTVPWAEVQAVLHHQWLGTRRARLILENGSTVTLRAPTTWLNIGAAEYERDFDRIGHWWLAHRGAAWRPMRPEAPQPPVEG